MPTDHTLGRSEKLKGKKTIDLLFSKGRQLTAYPIKLIYMERESLENPKVQVGFAVPKKRFKKAVERNRIKRLMREAYRLNKTLVVGNSSFSFAFLFLYLGKEMPNFVQVEQSVVKSLQKFAKKNTDEQNNA
ncbi:MAG: ribonuclease P protein component [Flavobacteriaceae bacterium]